MRVAVLPCPPEFRVVTSHLNSAALILLILIVSSTGCEEVAAPAAAGMQRTVLTASQLERRGGIEFVKGWELGRRVSTERGQPCLVFFTASWCTYCKRMEATTFNDAAVSQLASQFVCVMVDADVEPEVCRRLQVKGYPTLELISPAGASLGRLTGWQAAPTLAQSLRAALDRYAVLERDVVAR
jgi:thiol:disulfide interchange protein